MRDTGVRSVCRAGLLALALLAAFAGHAAAEVAQAAISRAAGAYAKISSRLSDPSGKNLPRLSVPADAEQLNAIYDIDAAVAGRPHSGQGVPALLEWIEVAKTTNKAFIYAGGATSDQAIEANVNGYAPEIALGTLFNMRLSVTMHQAALSFMAELPKDDPKLDVRKAGFQRMILGLVQQISGTVGMEFSGTPMAPGSEIRAAAALAQDVPLVAASLSQEQKAQLLAKFENARKKTTNSQTLKDLETAMVALKP